MNVAEEYARDAIRAEYMREREAYRQLIGTLYTGIVYQRLLDIRERFERAGGDPMHRPNTPPPLPSGHSPYFN